MWRISSDLVHVAERIADTENRISKLRDRVQRLRAEGSDASQVEGVLDITRSALQQLQVRQSLLRRSGWTISR
jgi:hypothetical protein